MSGHNGTKLSQRLHACVQDIWPRYLSHPFVMQMADGTLPMEKFRYYMLQDYLYLKDYVKIFAAIIQKADDFEQIRFLSGELANTIGETFRTHLPYMQRLGVTEDEIRRARPHIDNSAYSHYMLCEAQAGDVLTGLVTLLNCSWSYAYIAQEMAARYPDALQNEHYGAWFAGYVSEEYRQTNQALIDRIDALGADTYVIGNEPDGTNINRDCGSTHIENLQKYVRLNRLDVGFAFDGDADRCLCVDEKGNVITGDHILYIYGCYMKEHGELMNNTVVTTVMSNFGLYKAFDEQGIGYAKTAVGDKYVYEYMAKNSCRIGGEQSGHIIFSKYASTGDGILTSLKMMEVMLAKKKPMSELAAPLKIYPQVLENIRVTDKKAAQNDPAVQEAVSKVAEALGDTGRILVRESGTEPVVRVMVEAPDHDTCQKYVDEVVNVICEKGYKA